MTGRRSTEAELEAQEEMAMYGYLNQLVAEAHINELRATAARQRLIAQAAKAARAGRGRKSGVVAASAAAVGPVSAGVTRSVGLRVRPAGDC